MSLTPRIMEMYRKKAIPELQSEFGIGNVMAVPKILKVTVNAGIGRMAKDDAAVKKAEHDLSVITGQKPVYRRAKKSVSSFKIRKGVPVGLSVTLRGKRMYDFLDRLVSIALPMSKDFRGIDQKNVDEGGNLNIGIREHNIFPEVTYETLKDIFGMQVTVTTNARDHARGISLFKALGFPIKS